MNYDAQNRRDVINAITQKTSLQRRITRTQRQLEAAQGEARRVLEDSIATDQAAMAELTLTLEEVKARMIQEEEHIRRKTQEALRAKAELRASYSLYSLHHLPGGGQPSLGQAIGILVVLAAIVAIVSAALLLNR